MVTLTLTLNHVTFDLDPCDFKHYKYTTNTPNISCIEHIPQEANFAIITLKLM